MIVMFRISSGLLGCLGGVTRKLILLAVGVPAGGKASATKHRQAGWPSFSSLKMILFGLVNLIDRHNSKKSLNKLELETKVFGNYKHCDAVV